MSRRQELSHLRINKAVNGYIVDTCPAGMGQGLAAESVYVFESLDALTVWMKQNFNSEGGDRCGL